MLKIDFKYVGFTVTLGWPNKKTLGGFSLLLGNVAVKNGLKLDS